jgi:hypothetical protein
MKPDQSEVNLYLDGLRASGVTNMFGAGPYVEEYFGVKRHEAREYVITWMQTFSERLARGEVTE